VVTPGGAGLPRGVRLLRPQDFARVYEHRFSAAEGPIVVYAAPNDEPEGRVRLGLSVSRRVGSAVVRNRWKRRLREAFRTVRGGLPEATDLVVVVRGGPPPVGAEGLRQVGAWLVGLARRVTARRGYAATGALPSPRDDHGRGRRR
jgi:ribonuclease P protein component